MKNYFEILEVDIHASSEVINKAFKVLAKKYHPDAQQDANKKEWAEEQFKLLNEAYEVLSDDEKRENYTKELEFDKNKEIDVLMLKNADLEVQVENLKIELEQLRNKAKNAFNNANHMHSNPYNNFNNTMNNNAFNNSNNGFQTDYTFNDNPTHIENNYSHPPHSTMYNEPINHNYTVDPNYYYEPSYHPIRNKFKKLFAFFITILVMISIGFLIWKIPYTHNLLIKLYEENIVIHWIVNLFYK